MEASFQGFDKPIGLRKQITGIDQNDGHMGSHGRNHMQHDGRLSAETTAHNQLIAKCFHGPANPLLGAGVLQPGAGRIHFRYPSIGLYRHGRFPVLVS